MTEDQPATEPMDIWDMLAFGARIADADTASAVGPASPPNFPTGIPVVRATYEDWSLYIRVPHIWIATMRTPDDVVASCNWARDENYTVRALGQSHNWSPLVVPNGTPRDAKVVLLDTSRLTAPSTFQIVDGVPTATFGIGTTVGAATLFLEHLDNQGTGAAPGYSFQNMTAPGALSLGGVLAIGGHGTGVPWAEAEPDLNGCLSNLVTSFKAVVTDPDGSSPDDYAIRTFERTDPDAAAFLVHLGRAILTEVTLRVVPNYYLQVTNWYPSADVLFQSPEKGQPLPEQAISTLLDDYGRVEIIWFPFTSNPWVKTWKMVPEKIDPQVPGPYNYPWANGIQKWMSDLIRAGLFAAPWTTPAFGLGGLVAAQLNAPEGSEGVMNGTARDLLLYVENSTLRVTACGYVVQIPRSAVQQVAHDFYAQYTKMLKSYQDAGKYPINGPVEIRYTTIDRQGDLGVPGAAPPALAATHSVDPGEPSLDTVFWVDALTLPGTPSSAEFFTELEEWMRSAWGSSSPNGLRPEWSKGWAYTAGGGPWTNSQLISQDIPAGYNQASDAPLTFDWASEVLSKYDKFKLFHNNLLDLLFS